MKPTVKVWVTRPRPQGEVLARALRQAGYDVVVSPLLELTASHALRPQLLSDRNAYLWTSPAAVDFSTKAHAPEWGAHASFHAIGSTTARALMTQGFTIADSLQAPYTSEQWLAQVQLGSNEQTKVMIIKGEGGRETITQTLRARGYDVTHWNVYRRSLPVRALTDIQAFTELPLIIATSCESLANLHHLVQRLDLDVWYGAHILVTSPRILEQAARLGFKRVHLAPSAETAAIVSALKSLSLRHTV